MLAHAVVWPTKMYYVIAMRKMFPTNFPQHRALLVPEVAAAHPEYIPAVLVNEPGPDFTQQVPLGITAYGGTAIFEKPYAYSLAQMRTVVLAMTGLSNKQIAELLWVDKGTVSAHLGGAGKVLPPGYTLKSERSGFFARMLYPAGATEPLIKVTMLSDPEVFDRLPPKKIELLGHLAMGLSNPDIAQTMGITRSTVSSHINDIYPIFGSSSRALMATAFLMC